MEVEIVDQNLSAVDEEAELFGIDDVDTFIEITIEKVIDDVFYDISHKVDMDLAEQVVRELEDATGMELIVFHAPTSASRQESASAPTYGGQSTFIDMSAHIEQAIKCLLSAIEEQKEFLDGNAKVHVFQRLEELVSSMDTLIKTVADSLKLIGTTVQMFSDSVVKKLNCILVENQSSSKIIEHKIKLSKITLAEKMELKFVENEEWMKNMEEALETILQSQETLTRS
ncbi:hypothetical protein Dimus_026557 [Dionaea muscipula]